MPPSPSPPEFFLDRSLGGRSVAEALRAAGWLLRTHAEVYGARDQSVEDVEWLELCGRKGWAALTMDRRIRYRSAEIAAVQRHNVKLFALTSGNLTALEQAARFDRNKESILAASLDDGAFIYAVHAVRIMKLFPS